MAVRLYPLCSERRVTAPQAPLTTAAALPIHCSTGKVSIVVSLHDPSYFSLGLIRRLTCYRAAKLSTRFPQKTGVLRRSHLSSPVSPVEKHYEPTVCAAFSQKGRELHRRIRSSYFRTGVTDVLAMFLTCTCISRKCRLGTCGASGSRLRPI